MFLVSRLVALPEPLWKGSFPLVRALSVSPFFLLGQEGVLSTLVCCLDKNQLGRWLSPPNSPTQHFLLGSSTPLLREEGRTPAKWASCTITTFLEHISKATYEADLKGCTEVRACLFLFLERGRWRERNIDVPEIHRLVASHMSPTGDLACNPDMCPDQEWNQ